LSKSCFCEGDTVVRHRVDAASGKLTPAGQVAQIGTAVTIALRGLAHHK
jgi:hypothetical protein